MAYYLGKKNVRSDSIIAIMYDRASEKIIFILGILKAGAAYLPIDIHNPYERNLFMLDDSKANALLNRSDIIKDIPFNRLKNMRNIGNNMRCIIVFNIGRCGGR